MSRNKKFLIRLPTGISGLFIFVSIFFFFKCSDPLAFLLEETLITVDRESITLDEGGKEDSIAFRLNTSPVDDKTVVITGELACAGTTQEVQERRISVDKNTITFTRNNWKSWLRFVFTAPENLRQESDLNCEFVFNPSVSDDPGFSGQKIKNIPITIRDNDGDANIRLSETNITIPEGGNGSYTIRLTEKPKNNVTVNTISFGDFPERLPPPAIQPLAVTFTPENYDQPQTVTVTYAEGNQYFDDFMYTIKHRIVTVDPVYAAVADINFPEVVINLEDNDLYHVIVSQRSILRFDDVRGDTGASYTISLSRAPETGKNVTIDISNRSSAIFEVDPTQVILSDQTPKRITVRRVSIDGNRTMGSVNSATDTITHTIDTTSSTHDSNYDSPSIAPVDVIMDCTLSVDCDRDGLIDIKNAEMLYNMRYNLAGSSYKTSATDEGDTRGCPTNNNQEMRNICRGYGLIANIDLLTLLDTGGNSDGTSNGVIDTREVIVQGVAHKVIDTSKDTSWVPVGDNSTNSNASRFTGIFNGNGHTIANLWVNITPTEINPEGDGSNLGAGLFGYTGTRVIIRNVGIISGSIHGSFSDPGSASSGIFASGGLVGIHRGGTRDGGDRNDDLYIINSYVAGSSGVSSSYSSITPSGVTVSSGGLVGYTSFIVNITDSYFSGLGGIASSSSNPNSTFSGGLVGFVNTSFEIENSYFSGSGSIASGSASGGLLGDFMRDDVGPFTIRNSYWNTDAPQTVAGNLQTPKRARGDRDVMNQTEGPVGLTLAELMATSGTNHPSRLPNGANDSTKPWDLGRADQLPAIKICKIPRTAPDETDCDSYEELISGQR